MDNIMRKMFYYLIFIIILISTFAKAESEWINVHYIQFENFESINCRDGKDCYAFATYSNNFDDSGFRIYRTIDNTWSWELTPIIHKI